MDEASVVDIWERLVRFHRVATTVMDANLRATFGHSLDDYDVLHQIHEHGAPIRMGDLAERLLVANSSCNRIVGRLVDVGLLTRTYGTDDRRVVQVQLTAAGKALHRRMAAVHTRDIRRLVGSVLHDSDRVHLDRALRRLLEHGTSDGKP
ncbi:MAG: MarR family winged helix-turn-helix transcriptional regulator [Acidimicrobiales bacterium]